MHAYGFGGLGFIYSYGAAAKVRDLVNSLVQGENTSTSRSRL